MSKQSPIDKRLETELGIKPVNNETHLDVFDDSMPVLDARLSDLDVQSLEGEVELLFQLSKEGLLIKDKALGEVDDCLEQADKSYLISSAATALSASINAISKATQIKMSLLKLKGIKNEPKRGLSMDRNTLLKMLREEGVDVPSKES